MEELLESIENGDPHSFSQLLHNKKSLILYKDTMNSSLIHATAIYSATAILTTIFEHESKYSLYEEIQTWTNNKNSDGNSALLFAAMSNSLDIIKILLKFGAEINSVNFEGKNAIHIAAEKDYPHILSFLAENGAELTRNTIHQETPLHLAALMNSYKSLSLLLALKVTRKRQDSSGFTALHIAAKNNNGRIVRLLLLKGFDKETKDTQGRTAEDLTSDIQTKQLFHSAGVLQLFGYRPMVADGKKKNFLPLVTLFSLLISVFVINSVFLESYTNSGTYVFAFLIIVSIGLAVYLNLSDPGYIPKGEERNLTTLYSKGKDEVCPECCILKLKRVRHCFFCARCVGKYDHHCQWVNNCIGGRNLGVFFAFLVTMEAACVVLAAQCIVVFAGPTQGEERLSHGKNVGIAVVLFFIAGLGIVAVGRLLKLHFGNFLVGRTSSERFSKASVIGEGRVEYSLRNWWRMCCNVENGEK